MSKTFTELLMESHQKEQRQLASLGLINPDTPPLPIVKLQSTPETPAWTQEIKPKDIKEVEQAMNIAKTKDKVHQNLRGQHTQFRRRRKKS